MALRSANLSAKANQNQETSAASQINFPSRTGRFGTGFQQLRSERAKERKQYVYLTFVLSLAEEWNGRCISNIAFSVEAVGFVEKAID